MPWAETFPIPASRLVSLFRNDFNNIISALVTVQLGPLEPVPLYAGMFWADTNQGYLKQRKADNGGWSLLLKLEIDFGGAITRAGTAGDPMLGLIDMNGFPIVNVGAGTGASAARMTDLAAYLKADGSVPVTGLLRQGGAAAGQNPVNVDDLSRKAYVDTTRLAGGVYTGKITMPFAPTAGSAELVRQVDLENVRDNHVHNGLLGQGQKINIGNLSGLGQGAWRFPRASGVGEPVVVSQIVQRPIQFLNDCPTIFQGDASAQGWKTVSVAAWVAESGINGPYAALLNVELTSTTSLYSTIRFEVRKTGTAPGGPQRFDFSAPPFNDNEGTVVAAKTTASLWAEIDPTTRNFDYRQTGQGAVWIRLIAWLRQGAVD